MNMQCLDASTGGLDCLNEGETTVGGALLARFGQPILRTRREYDTPEGRVPESTLATFYAPTEDILPPRERAFAFEPYGLDNRQFNPRKIWFMPSGDDITEGDELDDGIWVYKVAAQEPDVFGVGAQQVIAIRDRRSEGWRP